MKQRLITRHCESENNIREFFDQSAEFYSEQHGNAVRLLNYRVKIIKKIAALDSEDHVLDIGCGTGDHLFAIAPLISHGIGIDFSAKMIEKAKQRQQALGLVNRLNFRVEKAQQLNSIPDQSVHRVICIGALEHMREKEKVFQQLFRVLRKKGRLVLLTPNGDYCWYTTLAPLFKIDTRHLSTDEFWPGKRIVKSIKDTGFTAIKMTYWTFIPRGDMHKGWACLLDILDAIGHVAAGRILRGGLAIRADK